MRSEHILRFVVVNGLALGLGAAVATSCIKVNYPTVAFRCNPRQPDNCPESHFCCSDDPSTAKDGSLPAYEGKNITGTTATPLYADAANRAGTSGMCVNRDEIPAGFGLLSAAAANCPIPCNPTWSEGSIEAVCGEGRVCCQTVEVGDKDCVLPDGETQWRPVSGADIGGDAPVSPKTNWNAVAHETHQDPNGSVCAATAGCSGQTCQGDAVFSECIRQLTVANQRGFCMFLEAGQGCPTTAATYQDACERKSGSPPM
jgi:hypothetical protein